MKKISLGLLGICWLFSFCFDDDLIKKIAAQLDKYMNELPQEKVYLHFDKPYYAAGDNIWFKAYAVDANTHHLDTLTGPIYVELINNKLGKIIEKRIIKLEKGFASGNFRLDNNLQEGFYRIRAYTNWMRNFPDELFFTKDFKVYNSLKSPISENNFAPKKDVWFFPEGGNLIEGLTNRIGFKAVNTLGKGIDVSGVVMTEKGDTSCIFESQHLGMGYFSFKPEIGKRYISKVKYGDGEIAEVAFASIQSEGYAMTVDAVNLKGVVRIFVENNRKNAVGEIAFIAQSKGQICYTAKAAATEHSFIVSIPRSRLPEGIVQLTVFDENSLPRCERVVFIGSPKVLTVDILANKENYQPREQTIVAIEVKDDQRKPVEGNFSLAVSDARQVLEKPFDENILTYLQLSSEVKGNIEQPAYYFDKSNIEVAKDLDILMMTQGWRRFNWTDIISGNYKKPLFSIEQNLSITGEVRRPSGKIFEKPVNLTILLVNQDSTQKIVKETVAKEGKFAFYYLDFKDSVKVVLQAIAGKNNSNTVIVVNSATSPKIEIIKIPFNPVEFAIKDVADYLKRRKEELEIEEKLRFDKIQLLKQVTVKAKKGENNSQLLYNESEATTIRVSDKNTSGAFSVFDVLYGRVAGLQVNRKMDGTYAVGIIGLRNIKYVIDGIKVPQEEVGTLNVANIDKVDVLKGAAYAGGYGGDGLIYVFTKSGNPNYDWNKEKTPGVEMSIQKGYYSTREFYVPNYQENAPSHNRPDFRSTVYWNPVVKTDKNGRATVVFYTTDAETKLRISVEGLSNNGIPVVAQSHYFVKK